MSQRADESSEETSTARTIIRTVTPGPRFRPDTEMNVVGWVYFLIVAVLLLPLAPLFLVVLAVEKALDAFDDRERAS